MCSCDLVLNHDSESGLEEFKRFMNGAIYLLTQAQSVVLNRHPGCTDIPVVIEIEDATSLTVCMIAYINGKGCLTLFHRYLCGVRLILKLGSWHAVQLLCWMICTLGGEKGM
jgi:hypothetical protein